MSLKCKIILVFISTILVPFTLIPIARANPDYSFIITDGSSHLEIIWKISYVNQTLIQEIKNEENYSSELFFREEGDSIYWDVSFIKDVEHSWCTGRAYYWEILVDEYIINQSSYDYTDSFYNSQYECSHKYRIQKFPGDFGREMLIDTNYFTSRIIPQPTVSFLEDLEINMRNEYFGFFSEYENYGFQSYHEYKEFLIEKSNNYQIDSSSILVKLSNRSSIIQDYSHDGLLNIQKILFNNQIAVEMKLSNHSCIHGDPPPPFMLPFILFVLLIIFSAIFFINLLTYVGLKDYYTNKRRKLNLGGVKK